MLRVEQKFKDFHFSSDCATKQVDCFYANISKKIWNEKISNIFKHKPLLI